MDSCPECGSGISTEDLYCSNCEFNLETSEESFWRNPSLERIKKEFTYDSLVNDFKLFPGIDPQNTKRRNVIVGVAYLGVASMLVGVSSFVEEDDQEEDDPVEIVVEWIEEEQHRDGEGLEYLNAGRGEFQSNRWGEAKTEFENAASTYDALVDDVQAKRNQFDTETRVWELFDLVAQFYNVLYLASDAGNEASYEMAVNEDPDKGFEMWDIHEEYYQESLGLAEDLRRELYGELREVAVDEIIHQSESFVISVPENATELSIDGNVLSGEYMAVILENPDGDWVLFDEIDERHNYTDSWSFTEPQSGEWIIAVEPATEGRDTEVQIIVIVESMES